jgi:hypothetical protein
VLSNRRSELLTNRMEKKVKIGNVKGYLPCLTFVPFALDGRIATFFDCLSRAIADLAIPEILAEMPRTSFS